VIDEKTKELSIEYFGDPAPYFYVGSIGSIVFELFCTVLVPSFELLA
jgi:hypothetical protein